MRYISTRDPARKPYSFLAAVMEGLAPDGGLLVPEVIPKISSEEWEDWKKVTRYQELFFLVMRKYISVEDISDAELRTMIDAAYSRFRNCEVVPIKRVGSDEEGTDIRVMELFHGPTYAFKDVALQLLGHLFDFALKKQNTHMTILGATSGDTGSAAIAGVKGLKNIDCVILFPLGRTSKIQELQMTANLEDNIHCIGVKESVFDDCQSIVKACFCDEELKAEFHLGAVNSINWARILTQIVYYVWGALQNSDRSVSFVVPTGNFGNVLAGYYAREMGVPNIAKLVVASNSNDILPTFFLTGEYAVHEHVVPTLSPSMDISVSSNFERFLFDLWGRNGEVVIEKLGRLQCEERKFNVTPEDLEKARKSFLAYKVDENTTVSTIVEVYTKFGYLLCPHSAVGYAAASEYQKSITDPRKETIITLATAHIGKFTEQLLETIQEREDMPPGLKTALENAVPPELRELANAPTRRHELPKSAEAVKQFLRENVDRKSLRTQSA
jgi:threonine synthase